MCLIYRDQPAQASQQINHRIVLSFSTAKLTDIDYRTNRRAFLGSNLQACKTRAKYFSKNKIYV